MVTAMAPSVPGRRWSADGEAGPGPIGIGQLDRARSRAMCRVATEHHREQATLERTQVDELHADTHVTRVRSGQVRDATAEAPVRRDDAGADRCTGTIGEVGGTCQASFDGTAASLPACLGFVQVVKVCAGLIAFTDGTGYTVKLTDGDNDFALKNFTVDIDGNNDGNFDATVNSAATTLSAAASSPLVFHDTLDHHLLAADHLMHV